MRGATRREFALGLAGAAAGLAAGRADAQEPAGLEPSVVAGISIGVQSFTFRRFDVDRMIRAMRSIGLSSVELWDGHLHPGRASDADFETARKKFEAAGIKISAYCVNFQAGWTDAQLERGFTGAALLGTSVMTATVKKAIVPRLDALCQKHELLLGLHNHHGHRPTFKGDRSQDFEGPEDFLDTLKGRSRYLAINLDVGHFAAAGHDPVGFLEQHHERIVSVHIKDRDKADDEHSSHRRFGLGATPIVDVARVLKRVKFRYAVNIEYEPEPDDPTEGVRHAFEYLKKALLA